jgi:alkylhydroperoxidase family enzyme
MPRISYFAVEDLVDPELRGALRNAARHGAPAPESQAVRAHVPEVLRAYSRAWERTYRHGVCDQEIKELCRCAVVRDAVEPRDERERAAVDYALAIAQDPAAADDALWARLHDHFSDAELVELGWFVGLMVGQHCWLQSIELGHGEVQSLNRTALLG